MIVCIEGKIREKNLHSAVVMAGGIGYEIFLPLRVLQKISVGNNAFFYTFQRLKEDVSELYGFDNLEEKKFFQTLLSISGVGPKTALALIEYPLQLLVEAVEKEDIAYLTQAPGLGKKTASRLILELKGKLPKNTEISAENTHSYGDIIQALESLGFDSKRIDSKVSTLPKKIKKSSEEDIMKYLLQELSA